MLSLAQSEAGDFISLFYVQLCALSDETTPAPALIVGLTQELSCDKLHKINERTSCRSGRGSIYQLFPENAKWSEAKSIWWGISNHRHVLPNYTQLGEIICISVAPHTLLWPQGFSDLPITESSAGGYPLGIFQLTTIGNWCSFMFELSPSILLEESDLVRRGDDPRQLRSVVCWDCHPARIRWTCL